jgi:hypothetical protein
MVTGLPFEYAHCRYLAAVAAAVQAAGVDPAGWETEPDIPRGGYLAPAPPVGHGNAPGTLWFLWDEESGWVYGRHGPDGDGARGGTDSLTGHGADRPFG